MKVSLIATVKDAGAHVGDFLDSVRAQTRPPDEIVIVDGGSTDGTVGVLRAADDVAVLEAPGANISRGRNLAIEAAMHEVIAVSDADCVLSPNWLEDLLAPIERGADVAMGFYRPIVGSLFEAVAAGVALPEADEVDPGRFMPSSRSVAFRREAFERGGRYPEWLDVGEDMYLNHRFRELFLEMRFVPEAVAYWRMRPTVAATWLQYFRYARGDAIGAMYPERHALRFGVYGTLAWAALTGRGGALKLLGAAAAWQAGKRLPRTIRLVRDRPAERALAVPLVPALIAFTDLAKMAGYVAGLLEQRHSPHAPSPARGPRAGTP